MLQPRMAGRPIPAAGIGALILVAALLAGCGTVSGPLGHGAGSSARHNKDRQETGPRGKARAYADRLLADLRLPHGARRAPWPARITQAMKPMLPAVVASVVDLRTLYRVAWPIDQVDTFLVAQVPAGLQSGDSGQSGHVGGTAPTAYYVDYNPSTLPPGIFEATLATAVVPARGGGSLVRVDAQVAWYPARSAAEHIDPGHYRAVTVTGPAHPYTSSRSKTRTFTERALVAKLATLFNRLPAEPDITINCPMESAATTYQVVFTPAAQRWPKVIAGTSGCGMDSVSVNGRSQPTLHDPNALPAEVNRLLKNR